jgi:hypothetical protein
MTFFEEAADAADIPEDCREQISKAVDKDIHDQLVLELAERMHLVYVRDVSTPRTRQLAQLGTRSRRRIVPDASDTKGNDPR